MLCTNASLNQDNAVLGPWAYLPLSYVEKPKSNGAQFIKLDLRQTPYTIIIENAHF